MSLRHELDVLTLYDPDRSTSTVNVWVAHPTPSEDAALGTLVAVISIDGNDRLNHDVISIIQEELRTNYYTLIELPPDVAFERALQRTNQRLHELVLEGISQWLPRAHIVVGAIAGHRMLVTTVGSMQAYLIRHERLHDMLGGPTGAAANPVRVFDHVVTGDLKPGDRVLFSTPSLLEYFSLEKIRRTLLDFPPHQAVRTLETTLLGVEPRVAFGSLALQFESAPDEARVARATTVAGLNAPMRSMEELVNRERSTEALLSPSIWPSIKDIAQQVGAGTSHFIRTVLFRRPQKRHVQPDATAVQRPRPSSGVLRQFRSRLAMVRPSRPTVSLPNWTSNRNRLSWSGLIGRIVAWFRTLGRQQRLATLVIAGSVFAIAVTILIQLQPGAAVTGTDQTATIQEITDRFTQADAAVLFGGDELVQEHVDALQTLIAGLPDRRATDRQKKQDFERRLQGLESRLARVETVTSPVTVADVRSLTGHDPRQLYVLGQNVVTADPDSGTVSVTNLDESSDPSIVTNSLDTGRIRTGTPVSPTAIIFVTNRSTFVEVNVAGESWRPIDAEIPNREALIQSLGYYQNRVYALDIQGDEIYRFARSANSLGTGVAWVRDAVDFAEARGVAVDGSIYVLRPAGLVEQYFGGRRNDFQLASITPRLEEPTRLWTDETSNRIYLVEPKQRRVAVFTKDGQLVRQYRSDAWRDLRDAVAVESAKELYILNGKSIQRISLID